MAEMTMAQTQAQTQTQAHAPTRPPAPPVARDAAIDAVRAGCLVVVFVLHAMMVGVAVGPDGPVLDNALEVWAGFAPATWFVQIMPLFFIVGGFSSWGAWQRRRARGASAAEFARDRLARLVRPAIPLVAGVGLALAAATAAGLPDEIAATASFRIGQPLWFLAVYLGCTALVPAMARLHERHRSATLVALVGAVVAVDAVRAATGIEAIGFANLAFVWLTMQQFGFLLAEGRIDRMPRAARLRLALCSLGGLAAITLAGPYTPDLLQNLNPPTICLVLLGTAQLVLFSLVREPLRRWAERPRPARVIGGFGEWGMTLYLWHLPAFVLLAAGLLAANAAWGLALPAPLTGDWWATRPLWLVAAAAMTALLVAAFARWERGGRARGIAPRPGGAVGRGGFAEASPALLPRVPAGIAVPAGVLGVGIALIAGFGPLPAALSLVLLGVALAGSRAGRASVAPGMSAVGGMLVPQHHM